MTPGPPAAGAGAAVVGALADWFAERGLTAHVSITDEVDMASAFVVVEKKENP